MKSTKKKAKAKSRSKKNTRRKTKSYHRPRPKTIGTTEIQAPSTPNVASSPPLKTCQEVEVGDIGGFGSPEELEEHEKRCSEPATSFCTNCGKNLCQNHYNMLHRDHDHTSGQATNTGLA